MRTLPGIVALAALLTGCSFGLDYSGDTTGLRRASLPVAGHEDRVLSYLIDEVPDAPRVLAEIETALADQGFVHRPGSDVDCHVWYEMKIVPIDDHVGKGETVRGRIFVTDAASGRLAWRGERKALLERAGTKEGAKRQLHDFVHEVLQYTTKL